MPRRASSSTTSAKEIAAEYTPKDTVDGAEPAAQADVESAVKHAPKGTIGDTVRPHDIVAKDIAGDKPVASQPDVEGVTKDFAGAKPLVAKPDNEIVAKDSAIGEPVACHPGDDIVVGEIVATAPGTRGHPGNSRHG